MKKVFINTVKFGKKLALPKKINRELVYIKNI